MNLEASGLAIVQRRILLSDNRGCVLYTDGEVEALPKDEQNGGEKTKQNNRIKQVEG